MRHVMTGIRRCRTGPAGRGASAARFTALGALTVLMLAVGLPFLVPTGDTGDSAAVRSGGIRSFYAARELVAPMASAPKSGARPLYPREFLNAYELDELRARGLDGAGVTVVVPAIDRFDKSDLDAFAKANALEPFDIQQVGEPPEEDFGEVTMDLSIIHAVAPRAKLVVANWIGPTWNQTDVAELDALLSRFPGSVWSWSLGWCEEGDTDANELEDVIRRHAEREGSVHFAASGDSGGYECYPDDDLTEPPIPSYIGAILPAAAPSVTAVGGTRVTVGEDARVLRETPWYWPVVLLGSGGGWSSVFAGRGLPDVAGDADPASGMVFRYHGSAYAAGGTSASAPLWAGLGALLAQALREDGKRTLGPFNPKLDKIGGASLDAFRHPVRGSNAVAAAEPGRDLVTGWGAPRSTALLDALLAVGRDD